VISWLVSLTLISCEDSFLHFLSGQKVILPPVLLELQVCHTMPGLLLPHFLSGLASNHDSSDLCVEVAGITGMSYCAQPFPILILSNLVFCLMEGIKATR
jgi:hypothetical protein